MIAPLLVFAAVLLELAVIYALGWLSFAWWDGGIVRRLLMTSCAAVVVCAIYRFFVTHPIHP